MSHQFRCWLSIQSRSHARNIRRIGPLGDTLGILEKHSIASKANELINFF